MGTHIFCTFSLECALSAFYLGRDFLSFFVTLENLEAENWTFLVCKSEDKNLYPRAPRHCCKNVLHRRK